VWRYIKDRNLPVNPLYFASYVEEAYGLKHRRYRSLGCQTCTEPIPSNASTISQIIEELKTTKTPERAGRSQDKEFIMRKLRSMGYM